MLFLGCELLDFLWGELNKLFSSYFNSNVFGMETPPPDVLYFDSKSYYEFVNPCALLGVMILVNGGWWGTT